MRTALIITSWVFGFAAVALLVAFEAISEEKTNITSIRIELIQPQNQLFLNKEDIEKMLQKEDDSLLFKTVNTINTGLLEESLLKHPLIAGAEVFSTLDGLLSVQVEQKEAIARVISTTKHYYLDAEGHPFPTTKTFSATVPVFTGLLDSASVTNAYDILNSIQTNAYFKDWLAEIHTNTNREIELIPIQGNHRVIFGNPKNASEKLTKLQGFYKNVVTKENLNDWKTLNVAYNELLVSTKY